MHAALRSSAMRGPRGPLYGTGSAPLLLSRTASARSSSPGPKFTTQRRPSDSRIMPQSFPKRSAGQHFERQPPPGLRTTYRCNPSERR